MAACPISLDDYRNNLNLRLVVQNLTREGYEETAVRRAVTRLMDEMRDGTMAAILVAARRQLLIDSRTMPVRRR